MSAYARCICATCNGRLYLHIEDFFAAHLSPEDPKEPRSITIDVRGMPRPQGSMRLHRPPNGNTAARYPAVVYAWRAQVQQAAAELAPADPIAGPVKLSLMFELPRPASHSGTGRNAQTIKASAPSHPKSAPDLDKLTRCICDALTDAQVWRDDAQVVAIFASKAYTTSAPGVAITVTELLDPPKWGDL
jgi:Holliday junction resolvase RusA-like endonuclease